MAAQARQQEEERRRVQAEREQQARQQEEERRRVEAERQRVIEEERRSEALRRRNDLIERFGADIAPRIMRKEIWIGATEDMIRESLGRPVDKDQKVLETKTKEIWKYHPAGVNRYRLRITFENGTVVGWDDKT